MSSHFSLSELKGLSKPATKLIESVSSAIGVLYEPTRIRRKAYAEADAAIIREKSKFELEELKERSERRIEDREIRRQRNIELITQEAITALPAFVDETPVDEDWIYRFYERSQDISNETMQSVWAQILAQEVATPGTFSQRSLNVASLLQKDDAELFSRFCSCLWKYERATYAITWHAGNVLDALNITYSEIVHLQSSGLLETNLWDGFSLEPRGEHKLTYFGRGFILRNNDQNQRLDLGTVGLSASGRELSAIVTTTPNERYLSNLIKHWKEKRISTERLD